MSAAIRDIVIEKGATLQLHFVISQSDGTPFDLTSYTGSCQVRENPQSSKILATATVTKNMPATDGVLFLVISAVDTANMKVGTYSWDLFIKTTSPVTAYRLVTGKVDVIPTVTR